ncbi:hypothetical protein DAEQUDRAFT_201263 [Daedalea quercina L-15889]|uniref:Uncharacterized protein n=1 Tax=Daedalea quercina L-15889 TaxID=1314783 RepID=A0A165U9W4_9APHY|nr:hypothetical protein DAEQUDRAFT_201263 [Daedalea quercina L-15889]
MLREAYSCCSGNVVSIVTESKTRTPDYLLTQPPMIRKVHVYQFLMITGREFARHLCVCCHTHCSCDVLVQSVLHVSRQLKCDSIELRKRGVMQPH